MDLVRARSGNAPLTIRASWPLEPSLNFCRAMYRLSWQPVDRGPLDRRGDFVILIPQDRDWLARLHVHPLYEDPVSGEVLASLNAPPR